MFKLDVLGVGELHSVQIVENWFKKFLMSVVVVGASVRNSKKPDFLMDFAGSPRNGSRLLRAHSTVYLT